MHLWGRLLQPNNSINLHQQLIKLGIFTRIPLGLSGHNREEAILWRAVLDQSLRDALSKSTREEDVFAHDHAFEWLDAKPGTVRTILDEDSSGNLVEIMVDLHSEFEEVCHGAGLPADFVRTTWHKLYNRMKR